jgi:hypothetical protein
MDMPYGVGPRFTLAIAVSVTDAPTAGVVVLAVREIEYVLLETRYVNSSAGLTGLVPPGPVTVTSTVPPTTEGLPDGAFAVIDVGEFTTTPVAAVPPKATVSPAPKFVPVMVTVVPPDTDPLPAEKMTPTAVETAAGDWPHVGAYVIEGVNAPSKTKQLPFAVTLLVNPGVGEKVAEDSSSDAPQ